MALLTISASNSKDNVAVDDDNDNDDDDGDDTDGDSSYHLFLTLSLLALLNSITSSVFFRILYIFPNNVLTTGLCWLDQLRNPRNVE